jgi:GNAT superfamily N-acetyltransferase
MSGGLAASGDAALHIEQITAAELAQYASIPARFEVRSILRVELIDEGLPAPGAHAQVGGMRLTEAGVESPYTKDYDAYGETPEDWPRQFDVSRWAFFLAIASGRAAGAAAVAFNTNGVHMLEGRTDLSVLWDIRVHPDWRGKGLGSELFSHACTWSRERGCQQMKIETQNVNVPACRFYASQGAVLGGINRFGYFGQPQVGDEVMLLWYVDL